MVQLEKRPSKEYATGVAIHLAIETGKDHVVYLNYEGKYVVCSLEEYVRPIWHRRDEDIVFDTSANEVHNS